MIAKQSNPDLQLAQAANWKLQEEMATKMRASESALEEKVRALRESEQRLRTVMENLGEDGVVITDLNGQVLHWNKAALAMHGFAVAEEWRLKLTELNKTFELSKLDGTVLDLEQWPLARITRGEKLSNVEVRVRRIDADWNRIFTYGGGKVHEANGKQVAFVTITDITERKQAEEARRASELRYRRLFESARDGILILDGPSGKIVDVNRYLVEMLSYSREELLGRELWQVGTFKDISASKAAFAELQARGYVRYDDLPLESREGTITHVEVVANGYLEGDLRVVQCNIRDITERREAEQVLQQTHKQLEQTLVELKGKTSDLASMTQQLWHTSKLATMGELAASVAHELNNPLATISLRIESLAVEFAADEEKSRVFKIIADEVDRMGKLTGNLLQFSRHSHQQISTLDIRREIENSLELVEYHLRSRNIEVVQEFADALPAIQADRQQLRQVLLNLLTNASDAMPEGGTLTTRVRSVEPEGGVRAVTIELTDSGLGIAPAEMGKIWEPFFTTKPEGKGTGLGLAISRRAIEAHEGTISIESQLGKGTTVTIVIPVTSSRKHEL